MSRMCSTIVMSLLTLALGICGADALEAGAAKVEITPSEPTPLTGYGDRDGRFSEGVHDPLWARALYLNDGETPVLLVNLDLCYVLPSLRDRVLDRRPETVPADNIFLTATHTHNGPGGMSDNLLHKLHMGRYMPEMLDALADGIAQATAQAVASARRASLGYATPKQTVLSKNRRVPGGPIDEQIGVIRVDDADGAAIAIVANFAAHPTSVPEEDHYHFSADYPGYFYDELERLANPGCVALFLNGAEGDQTIGNPEDKAGWERVASVGRLLAVRVKAAANDLTCGDVTLKVGHAVVDLPRTLATAIVPGRTVLKTLEINDLLLSFVPGEPCVSIGKTLRAQALERGYAAQFTVGLANDYILYMTDRTDYRQPSYEAACSMYGPGMTGWLAGHFGTLMSRGSSPEAPVLAEAPAMAETEGILSLTLSGSSAEIGEQRGAAFGQAVQTYFEERIVRPLREGVLAPDEGVWNALPRFIDATPILLPVLAIATRPRAADLPEALVLELEGMARGADLPFDAIWLAQNAHELAAQESTAGLYDTPLCTMFAVAGDRAGAERLLVGRNLDWDREEQVAAIEVRPDTGHAFLQVGFPWHAGVFTGMNDAGLVVCAERMAEAGPPSVKGVPMGMALREVLGAGDTVAAAAALLARHTQLKGYRVLLAGLSEGKPACLVIELGRETATREVGEDGLLLGADPADPSNNEAARTRYGRVRELLAGERIVGRGELEGVLADESGSEAPLESIHNALTRYSVVFAPRSRTAYVAARNASGEAGGFQTFTIGGGMQ